MPLALVLLLASPALAQRVISTIEPGTSATRVARIVSDAAARQQPPWSFEPQAGCAGLRDRLQQEASIAVLTTADCLPELAGASFDHVTANVGSPALCFTVTRPVADVFVNNTRIAILKADRSHYKVPLEQALRALDIENPIVDASSNDYEDLLNRFRDPQFNAACVFEDGSGTAAGIMRLAGGRPVVPPQIDAGGRSAGGAFVIRQQFVTGPWATSVPSGSVLAFPISASIAAPRPPTALLASVSSTFSASVIAAPAEPTHNQLPMRGVTPILFTKGAVPSSIIRAASTAILGASIDASINPCLSAQQGVYRSFLLAAIHDVLKVPAEVALWEHATLLASRNDADPHYRMEKEYADTALVRSLAYAGTLSDTLSRATEQVESEFDHTQCPVPKRYWFFRPGRFAYYQYGVRRLRDALAAAPVRTDSTAFRDAASCLKAAFVHADGLGRTPTCGDRLSGMWTTYYAPYMAWAVIEAERHNVRP